METGSEDTFHFFLIISIPIRYIFNALTLFRTKKKRKRSWPQLCLLILSCVFLQTTASCPSRSSKPILQTGFSPPTSCASCSTPSMDGKQSIHFNHHSHTQPTHFICHTAHSTSAKTLISKFYLKDFLLYIATYLQNYFSSAINAIHI